MIDLEYLKKKRIKVLEAIKPICEAFDIEDYDYIVRDYEQTETLRIYNTYIGCSYNSIEGVINELIGYIFVKIYCHDNYIGAFQTQTLNVIKRYWLSCERVLELGLNKEVKQNA